MRHGYRGYQEVYFALPSLLYPDFAYILSKFKAEPLLSYEGISRPNQWNIPFRGDMQKYPSSSHVPSQERGQNDPSKLNEVMIKE